MSDKFTFATGSRSTSLASGKAAAHDLSLCLAVCVSFCPCAFFLLLRGSRNVSSRMCQVVVLFRDEIEHYDGKAKVDDDFGASSGSDSFIAN